MSGAVGRARGDFSSDSVVPFTLTPIRGHDRRRIEPIRDRKSCVVFFVFHRFNVFRFSRFDIFVFAL